LLKIISEEMFVHPLKTVDSPIRFGIYYSQTENERFFESAGHGGGVEKVMERNGQWQ
jgi:phage replication-related protein YjqB (UPF0714/DUF867 family)